MQNSFSKNCPAQQIVDTISLLYNSGMTTTSGGNISIMDNNGDLWITPSGIDKGNLKPDQIICMKEDGTTIGNYKPSMEYPFHKAIYKVRPDIKAIVHAHSPALVSYSIAHEIPQTNITPHYAKLCGNIGFAKYSIPGSDGLGVNIAQEFSKGLNCVMMENHGAVVASHTITDAYLRFQALEFCARTQMGASTLGSINLLETEEINSYLKNLEENQRSKEAIKTIPNPSPNETLVSIASRAFKHEIIEGIGGSISERNKQGFTITPQEIPLNQFEATDLSQLIKNNLNFGEKPSFHAFIHQILYTQNNEINAVIIAQPPSIMAFATSNTFFDLRTIPESWMFLKNMDQLSWKEFDDQLQNNTSIFANKNGLVIIKNHFILSTGKSLIEAFDRLEVAEFSAKSVIQASSIGSLKPISHKQIDDLREKFGSN